MRRLAMLIGMPAHLMSALVILEYTVLLSVVTVYKLCMLNLLSMYDCVRGVPSSEEFHGLSTGLPYLANKTSHLKCRPSLDV